MRAAVYKGGGKPLALETLPDPAPGPDEVLLRVHRCGICGSDLHMTCGHPFDYAAGTVPGHEYSGEVVAVGKGVGDFRVGDLITALPGQGCGRSDCEACRRGNQVLCPRARGVLGGFGEYIAVPAAVALKLPGTLSLADGALIEPLAVGLYGTRVAGLQPGERVLVLGAGSVALCTIYWAHRLGAGHIVAMSRSARRAGLALQLGAREFLQYGENELDEVVEALGGPPDLVFECVGAEGFLARSIQHARPFGRVISLGYCTSPDPLVPAMAGMKGVSLQFPVGYSLADFQYVADEMDQGQVDPGILVSSVVALEDLPATFEALRGPNAETKVQVSPV